MMDQKSQLSPSPPAVAVNNLLKRFHEFNKLNDQCSIFPAVRELLMNLTVWHCPSTKSIAVFMHWDVSFASFWCTKLTGMCELWVWRISSLRVHVCSGVWSREFPEVGFWPRVGVMHVLLDWLYSEPSTVWFWPVYSSCQLCPVILKYTISMLHNKSYSWSRTLILGPGLESRFFRSGVWVWSPKFSNPTIGVRVPQKLRTPHPCVFCCGEGVQSTALPVWADVITVLALEVVDAWRTRCV